MNPQATNIIVLVTAVIVPVYMIIRMPRFGYPLGVLVVCFFFLLRDTLFFGRCENGTVWPILFFSRFLVGVSYCTPVYGLKELFLLLRNRERGMRPTWRKKVLLVIVGGAVLLVVPMWWLWVGLMQCYAYHKVVSEPSWGTRLSVSPTKIELPKNQDVPSFSLGYAEVAIQPELISSIECPFGAFVDVRCSGVSFLFMEPFSQTYEELSQGIVKSGDFLVNGFDLWRDVGERAIPSMEKLRGDPVGRLTIEMIEDPYSWNVKVVNTMPKTYSEIFSMDRGALREYLALVLAKVLWASSENGIGIFEAEDVCGIIHFGEVDKPEHICSQVFSRESNIGQAIHVRSESAEKSEEAMLSLLASHKFTLSEVPGKDELREMVIAEISKHDKFKKTDESQIEE